MLAGPGGAARPAGGCAAARRWKPPALRGTRRRTARRREMPVPFPVAERNTLARQESRTPKGRRTSSVQQREHAQAAPVPLRQIHAGTSSPICGLAASSPSSPPLNGTLGQQQPRQQQRAAKRAELGDLVFSSAAGLNSPAAMTANAPAPANSRRQRQGAEHPRECAPFERQVRNRRDRQQHSRRIEERFNIRAGRSIVHGRIRRRKSVAFFQRHVRRESGSPEHREIALGLVAWQVISNGPTR